MPLARARLAAPANWRSASHCSQAWKDTRSWCSMRKRRTSSEWTERNASGQSPAQDSPCVRKCSDRASKVAWASRASPLDRRNSTNVEGRPQGVEKRPPDRPCLCIIDELRALQPGEAFLDLRLLQDRRSAALHEPVDRTRIDIEGFEKQARGWGIGRDLRA